MAGLKVNFSTEEASSEGRSFDPIPSGEYYCRVTDVDDRECGPESKNPGKPYWAIEFTVQDGDFEDRKLWTNCMLFEGALYTLAQLLKATGNEKALETGNIPEGESFVSQELIVIVKKQRNAYMEAKNGDGEPVWSNEVKGLKPYEGVSPAKKAGKSKTGGSLLP